MMVKPGPKRRTPYERAQGRWEVDRKTGCWLWFGSLHHDGYGVISSGGSSGSPGVTNLLAHRVVYEGMIGPIPKDLCLDHLCRVRKCVNPSHLELVTWKTNILRGEGRAAKQARRTHCIHGHEFTTDNIYRKNNGGRGCKTCRKRIDKARRARNVTTF